MPPQNRRCNRARRVYRISRRKSLVSTALFQSGVAARNGVMAAQLEVGAEFFTVPVWNDLANTESNLSIDDPTVNSVTLKVAAYPQIVRKSFLNQS
jgi:hypothetical protein